MTYFPANCSENPFFLCLMSIFRVYKRIGLFILTLAWKQVHFYFFSFKYTNKYIGTRSTVTLMHVMFFGDKVLFLRPHAWCLKIPLHVSNCYWNTRTEYHKSISNACTKENNVMHRKQISTIKATLANVQA